MSSQADARIRALTVELASSAPIAPPMPDLDQPVHSTWRGPRVAAAVAAIAILVPLVTAMLMTSLSTRDTPPAADTAAVFRATGATPVAIVADDGVVLRGYFWEGGSHGVILNQGFGSDSTEIIRLATAANGEGAAVLLFESRGQGGSDGSADPSKLGADIVAAARDLATRGVESMSLIAFSHSATAAIGVAAEPTPAIRDVVAVFPFERYQNLNAHDFIGSVQIPVVLIGTSYPSPSGPNVVSLLEDAPDRLVTAEILDFRGDDISLIDAHMERLIEVVRQRAR